MGHTDLCKWGRLVVFPHPLRPSPLSVWCVQANDRRWAFESQLGCVAVSEAFLLSGPQYARLYNGRAALDDLWDLLQLLVTNPVG